MECCTDIAGLPLLFVIETYLDQVRLVCIVKVHCFERNVLNSHKTVLKSPTIRK